MNNKMTLEFLAISENESFARVGVASFIAPLDPTLDELTEIKTVVSEAVTNAVIHGYENEGAGMVKIIAEITGRMLKLVISDQGVGIENLEEAKQPLFTTKPELERSGMGFTIMENFMDHVRVESSMGKGTSIYLEKELIKNKALCH